MSLLMTDAFNHLASEGAVNVDFDLTVVGQVVLFVALMLVLKPWLFDPMLKLFEERERRIDGAKRQARKLDEKSAGALKEYEDAMQTARVSANAERDKLRAEGQKIEVDILAKVRASAAETLEEGRKRAEVDLKTVRASLDAENSALAKDLATRVLGREVQG